jgi:succinate dehydrogenase / fumarate reductase cytochrome b subunit
MIVSGLIVLVFVPLHLWTFKFGAWYEDPATPGMRDLHRLVVEVFRDPLHVAWYVVAMTVIGFHLWHGFASGVETLGVGSRRPVRRFSRLLAVALAGGFAIIPIVLFLRGGSS